MKAETVTSDAGRGRDAAGDVELPREADLPAPPARVHLVGAGGAGMRGLAVLLAKRGHGVDGCDRAKGARAPEITDRGGELRHGHDPSHVEGAGLVVRSSAVPGDHAELEEARRRGVPVWTRARALAALVNDRVLVAVGGTHGKTTITAMATLAARAAGLDPTGVVGGRVPEWGAHAVSGSSDVAVVEADEYDGSFLELDPDLAVVSAVEPEHLESYGGRKELEEAFGRFARRAAGRLGVLRCLDDAGARALGEEADGPGYGFAEEAAYRVVPLPENDGDAAGEAGPRVRRARMEAPEATFEFGLGTPGRHNLQNAAAALAVALRLGADPADLEEALAGFRGVERRLELLADVGGVAVVDDYAHHPTEVRASRDAVRETWPGRRLVAVFQPHLFSRTEQFADEFGRALSGADEALVLPVYPAREEPRPGVDASLIVDAAPGLVPVEAGEALERAGGAAEGTVLLFMGAGDVTELAHRAAEEVERRALEA